MTKLPLFDSKTGAPSGEIDIPEEVIWAATLVENWLRSVNGQSIGGLTLRGKPQFPGERRP